VDHINGDNLDNRKKNLRLCTYAENNRNRKPLENKTSKYKGVGLNKNYKIKTWQARIVKNSKRYSLGYFKNEKEAALAYNQAAKKYFGEFAYLNYMGHDK